MTKLSYYRTDNIKLTSKFSCLKSPVPLQSYSHALHLLFCGLGSVRGAQLFALAKQWTKMILSCSRAIILSSQTEDAQLHSVELFAQNVTSAWTNGRWRMKYGLYTRPRIRLLETFMVGVASTLLSRVSRGSSCRCICLCDVWAVRPTGIALHGYWHSCLSIPRN